MGAHPTFDHVEARRLRRVEGWTHKRIAEHFGKSRKTIQQVCGGVRSALDNAGIDTMQNFAAWQAEKIVAGLTRRKTVATLYEQGLKQAEIAVRVGVSRSRIGNIIAELRAVGEIDMVPVEIPAWTPAWLHDTYLNISASEGEEVAASHCRRLKAEAAASCR